MNSFVTFGGLEFASISSLEEHFGIKVMNQACVVGDKPYENKHSFCSCSIVKDHITPDDFLAPLLIEGTCAMCKDEFASSTKTVIKSPSCTHQLHYDCAVGWLIKQETCPICGAAWVVDNPEAVRKRIVDKYNLKGDVIPRDSYAMCTPNSHGTTMTLSIEYAGTSVSVNAKYSTKLSELHALVRKELHIVESVVGSCLLMLKSRNIPNTSTLDIYTVGITDGDTLTCTCSLEKLYGITTMDNFLVVHLATVDVEGSQDLQDLVGDVALWKPYPYIKDVSDKEMSCFLSSLYVMIHKASRSDVSEQIIRNFGEYMELYDIGKAQMALASESLGRLLAMTGFKNSDRMILICMFRELLLKMVGTDGGSLLLQMNKLCELLMFTDKVEMVNWSYQKPQVFGICAPLLLTNSIPPMLTVNETNDVVVFIGKGKDISLPIILYNPLTNAESHVSAAELAKTVGDSYVGLQLNRTMDEGIVICFDVSGSMDNCSNFYEDRKAERKEKEKAKTDFYKILDEDLSATDRELKNAVIWFITHPNFNDWCNKDSHPQTVRSIILFEQTDNPQVALTMSQNKHVFSSLLRNHRTKIGGKTYSVYRKNNSATPEYLTEPPKEFICPITGKIMDDPVIAQDEYTYERKKIEKWFQSSNRSPMTARCVSKGLLSNTALKRLIGDWKDKNLVMHRKGDEIVDTDKNLLKIKVGNAVVEFKFDEEANIYDLKYEIYQSTGLTHDMYLLCSRFKHLTGKKLIKKQKNITAIMRSTKTHEIVVTDESNGNRCHRLEISTNYTAKNIIYRLAGVDFYKYNLWYSMTDSGDGFRRGTLLHHASELTDLTDPTKKPLTMICNDRYLQSGKKSYLTRLDVVKQLFDSFINRSIAYSFNTSIGLISFNDKVETVCEITPYYESFRGHVFELEAIGATELYKAVKQATDVLVKWQEKNKNANLRIVCLSDGKDTGASWSFKNTVKLSLMQHKIVLDSIMIGDDFDSDLPTISTRTGGYAFNPPSIKCALDIMELETMVSSANREIWNFGTINDSTTPPMKKPAELKQSSSEISSRCYSNITSSNSRIEAQILGIMKSPHPNIDVYINDDNVRFWKLVFVGPDGTPYGGGTWLAYMAFPEEFPNLPPTVRFVTPIKHCNINSYGKVCHSILDRNYTPNTAVALILQCIYGLLLNPDTTDPLDTNLSMLYYAAEGEYEAQIIKHTKDNASKSRKKWKAELA